MDVSETSQEAEVCGEKGPPKNGHNQPPLSACFIKSTREFSGLDHSAFQTLLCSACEFVTLQNLWSSLTWL